MSGGRCKDCIYHYIGTGGVVLVLWLVTALLLWILRKKTEVSGAKTSGSSCEMTPVTDAEKEDTLVYHQIAFTNGNRKPRENNPEEEVTYAQVKLTSLQDDGVVYSDVKSNIRRKKADDAPISSDSQTTYAEIKPISKQPQPQPQELYAAVNKKKGNAETD